MLTHIVLMRFKEKESAVEAKARLETLPAQIEQIKVYEIGLNILESDRNYDLALTSKFESMETMEVYQKHPKHVEVLEYIKTVVESVVAVDYESD